MKNKIVSILTLTFLLIASSNLFAQQSEKNNLQLTGHLLVDSKTINYKYDENLLEATKFEVTEKKSPIKAGLFSLVLPGAGQYYNGETWQTIAFVVVEAALITTAVVYNNKGNTKTDQFQNYAQEHWSVKRYANWTLDHLTYLDNNLPHDKSYYENRIYPNGQNGELSWDGLNELESDISYGYTHMLYPFGDQQYYEMIGKYTQFSHGWDDSNQQDTDYRITSPNLEYYASQRGEANNLYNISTKAVVGIYINHILSALEAAWGAARFNKNIALSVRVVQKNNAYQTELVPTMNIKFSF
ncbi:MAG TPA: DUF5683 domain-containing protein [Ignavibacteriaceae bacterium]|nr:DUF5683 domain-containing protein [Ignavibacteriaceae bacterium]